MKQQNSIINELYKIRLLEDGEEEIEKYELLLDKVAQQGDYTVIGDLCKIADDDICEVSAGQYLIDVIVGIVEKEKTIQSMEAAIGGSIEMLTHASVWARMLHICLIRNVELRNLYVDVLKKINGMDKEKVVEILKKLITKQENPQEYIEILNQVI